MAWWHGGVVTFGLGLSRTILTLTFNHNTLDLPGSHSEVLWIIQSTSLFHGSHTWWQPRPVRSSARPYTSDRYTNYQNSPHPRQMIFLYLQTMFLKNSPSQPPLSQQQRTSKDFFLSDANYVQATPSHLPMLLSLNRFFFMGCLRTDNTWGVPQQCHRM